MRARQVNAHAVQRPDLNYEVIGRVVRRKLRRDGVLDGLIAKDEGGLTQVIVEECIRLDKSIAINDQPARDADEHHSREQPSQQARPDGSHDAGLTRYPTPRTLSMKSFPSLRRSPWM